MVIFVPLQKFLNTFIRQLVYYILIQMDVP